MSAEESDAQEAGPAMSGVRGQGGERGLCSYCRSRHELVAGVCLCTCGPWPHRFQLGVEPGCPIHAPTKEQTP